MVDGQFRTGPTANWDSTASSTTVADTILIGAAFRDDASTHTSVATGSATEIHDFESTDSIGLDHHLPDRLGDRFSYGATGTWSGVPGFTDGGDRRRLRDRVRSVVLRSPGRSARSP